MDLGASVCAPKRPACALCPWNGACEAHRRGDPENFPRKAPKAARTPRHGAAFVVLRAGAVLVRTRPMRGLLGGMSEVPTTEWQSGFNPRRALAQAPRFPSPPGMRERKKIAWRRVAGVVTHTFTHFPLALAVYRAEVAKDTKAPRGARFVPLRALDGEALPSVMRKVLAHALDGKTAAPNARAARRRQMSNLIQPGRER